MHFQQGCISQLFFGSVSFICVFPKKKEVSFQVFQDEFQQEPSHYGSAMHNQLQF